MSPSKFRKFKCKDEELPVVAGFIQSNLKRDFADFTELSPKYNEEFLSAFENLIAEVSELVAPEEETVKLKLVTKRLYENLDLLVKPLNKLEIYLSLAEDAISISAKDFGLFLTLKAIRSRDVEQVLDVLKLVNHNIARYEEVLIAQGMPADQLAQFTASAEKIEAENLLQHELLSGRKQLVLDNIELLNALYKQMQKICKTGKALYRNVSDAKLSDYTYAKPLREVRHTAKKQSEQAAELTEA